MLQSCLTSRSHAPVLSYLTVSCSSPVLPHGLMLQSCLTSRSHSPVLSYLTVSFSSSILFRGLILQFCATSRFHSPVLSYLVASFASPVLPHGLIFQSCPTSRSHYPVLSYLMASFSSPIPPHGLTFSIPITSRGVINPFSLTTPLPSPVHVLTSSLSLVIEPLNPRNTFCFHCHTTCFYSDNDMSCRHMITCLVVPMILYCFHKTSVSCMVVTLSCCFMVTLHIGTRTITCPVAMTTVHTLVSTALCCHDYIKSVMLPWQRCGAFLKIKDCMCCRYNHVALLPCLPWVLLPRWHCVRHHVVVMLFLMAACRVVGSVVKYVVLLVMLRQL